MSKETKRDYEDPKNAFLFSLNQDMQDIYRTLKNSADSDSIERGTNSMCVYIQRLEIPDGHDYDFIRFCQDKWLPHEGWMSLVFHGPNYVNFDGRHSGMWDAEIWKVWRELNRFMNATYFKGWTNVKPTHGRDGNLRVE
jgi:hypothetical protein